MDEGRAEAFLGSRYVLLDEIGAGAMGTVWRARHRETGEIVAVKLLRSNLAGDQDLVLRFVQERNVLRTLRHPHIVTMRDFVIEGERLALVMDLVEGGDLRGLLQQHGTLPPAMAAELMAQVAEALAAAHATGVVHRDVKPGNVLIDGPSGQVRLTDFGVARIVLGPGLTQTTSIIGTPTYLSPEVADGGAPTPAVDVYAAGLILYELLAGRPPFVGEHPMALLRQHAMAMPRRLPGMPDALWSVIAACTAKDPGARPAAGQVAVALREAAPVVAGLAALPRVGRADAPSATSEPLPGPPESVPGLPSGPPLGSLPGAVPGPPPGAFPGAVPPPGSSSAAVAGAPGEPVRAPDPRAASGDVAGAGAASGVAGGDGTVPSAGRGAAQFGTVPPAGPGSPQVGTASSAGQGSAQVGANSPAGLGAAQSGVVPSAGQVGAVQAGTGAGGSPKRSRRRLVVIASTTTAVALTAVAVAVMAPWRTPGAGAVNDASGLSVSRSAEAVGTPTPVGSGTAKESPVPLEADEETSGTADEPLKSSAKKTPKEPVRTPGTAVQERTPSTTTDPTATRTADPRRTSAGRRTEAPHTVDPGTEGDGAPPRSSQPDWKCRSWITVGGGSGVEMSPCMAMVGDVFYLMGRVRGASSVRSDVHVQLYNTDADRNVSQPFTCSGVSPRNDGEVATCGPFTTTAPPIQAKHDVRQRWRRTGTAAFGGGAESPWMLW
ncbi:protein kinase [Nonomuraea sp. NPDC049646]|uniref:serine/threonine-protein kinase n=1 Tax=unclassified Nonomuraea TaxID=2593643 RepID=UPI0037B98EF5